MKILFLISLSSLFIAGAKAQTVKSYAGTWVNSGYLYMSSAGVDPRVLECVSPQLFDIDSSGVCTIYLRTEQRTPPLKPRLSKDGNRVYAIKYNERNPVEISLNEDFSILYVVYKNSDTWMVFLRKK